MNPIRLLSRITIGLCLLAAAQPAHGHGDVMRIGSSQAGGGQLVIESEFDFGLDVHLGDSQTVGNLTLYTAIIPSFAWILDASNGNGHFPLSDTVVVSVSVADPISAGASMSVEGRILDAAGESAILGTFSSDPEDHIHPVWRLLLDNGVVGEYSISFRLSTTAPGYTTSPVYQLTLTNAVAEATATATATPTPTATPPEGTTPTATEEATTTPSPSPTPEHTPTLTPPPSPSETHTEVPSPTVRPSICVGDCNADGTATIDELVRAVAMALGEGSVEACAAADRDDSGTITVDELVAAVGSALSGCHLN